MNKVQRSESQIPTVTTIKPGSILENTKNNSFAIVVNVPHGANKCLNNVIDLETGFFILNESIPLDRIEAVLAEITYQKWVLVTKGTTLSFIVEGKS